MASEGAEVHAVSRYPVKEGARGSRWWQSDLLDPENLKSLLRQVRPDFVFHLSGHVSAAPQIENVLPAFHSLLTSTINLLTLSSDLGCTRLIVTGSLTEPPPGKSDTAPSSPYAAAKWAGAAFARMFHSLYRAPVVITRPYMAYGPRQHPSKLIPYTIASLAQGIAPKLSGGARAADWIYISDVIEGMVRAATAADVEGCTIEFGCGKLTSIRDVVRRLVAIMGSPIQPAFGALPDRPAEENRVADVGYAYAKLGWRPTVSLDDGLAATVRSFRNESKATGERPAATAS